MKVVGLMPLYDEKLKSYWMLPAYMKMIEEFGAIPLMLPLTTNKEILEHFLSSCDGFLLTGGQDVNPKLYGEKRLSECGVACDERDEMDEYILKRCMELDKPLLGICRGVQLMNACCGGSLFQDLPSQFKSEVCHQMTPPYDRVVHKVSIEQNSPLFKILEQGEIGVNSYHHQAIKSLSPLFKEMARSEDGLIEAIFMEGKKFIIGVQWHPELSYQNDENSKKLIGSFVKSL